MKESEYIASTDLARMRMVASALRSCYDEEAKAIELKVQDVISRLEAKVDAIEFRPEDA